MTADPSLDEAMAALTVTALRVKRERDAFLAALHEIAEGCIERRPGHCDAGKNRTKARIEEIARAAIAKTEAA